MEYMLKNISQRILSNQGFFFFVTLAVRKDNKVTQIKKADFIKQIEKENIY